MDRARQERMPWIVVLCLVVLVCALSWLVAYLIRSAVSSGGLGNYRAYVGAEGSDIVVAGDCFVYYDGSALRQVHSNGKDGWNCFIGGDAEYSVGEHGAAVWSGDVLTLVDMKTGTITYNDAQGAEILSARMGAEYAAVLLGPQNASSIQVMDHGGRPVYTADFDQLTVIDYGFFSSDSLLWVMALDTSGSVPTCEITTYKPSSMRIVGAISDTEQLMYNVTFLSTSVCCTGVTYYKVYDYTGTEDERRRKLVYGWYLMSADDANDPMMAFVPAGQADGSSAMQDVRMLRSNVDQTVRMPFPCADLVARGSHVYGFSEDGHVMVASVGRQTVEAYALPFGIDRVYGVTSDGVAVVSSGSGTFLISLGE